MNECFNHAHRLCNSFYACRNNMTWFLVAYQSDVMLCCVHSVAKHLYLVNFVWLQGTEATAGTYITTSARQDKVQFFLCWLGVLATSIITVIVFYNYINIPFLFNQTYWSRIGFTVPIRRNLTGNANANGKGTDTERVWEREQNGYRTAIKREQNGYGTDTERIQNGYRTDTEQIRNGYRTGMGTRAERKQNVLWKAFTVRFLLIRTVSDGLLELAVLMTYSSLKFPVAHWYCSTVTASCLLFFLYIDLRSKVPDQLQLLRNHCKTLNTICTTFHYFNINPEISKEWSTSNFFLQYTL